MINVNQAVIFVGGLGTRLGAITKRVPKPLIKIDGKPFIDHLIKKLSQNGIEEVILLTGYKRNIFKKKYHNKILFNNTKVICSEEKKTLGTGGALLNARKHLKQFFFLINGDTYFDFNIHDLKHNFLNNKKYIVNFALKEKKNKRYSKVLLKKNKIIEFSTKKKSTFINTGHYLVKKKILKFIKKKISSLELDVFSKLAKKGMLKGKIFNKKFNKFIDIGIPQDLNRADKFIKRSNKKGAVFLDRDGVINKNLGYVHKIKDIIWRKKIFKFLKQIKDNNFYLIVISNQSGVGRGYYSEKTLNILHDWMNKQIMKNYSCIDKFYYSPYYSNSKIKKYSKAKFNRKPQIGLFNKAKKEFNLEIKNCYMIGDKEIDMEFAKKCKIKGFRLNFSDDIFIVLNKILKK
tara:strand:- start:24473 stop:25681 length:1209 start_codon:yes stop_codon:yes gene_type:complete